MEGSDEPLVLPRSRAERYLAQAALRPPMEDERLPPGVDREAVDRQRWIALETALSVYRDLGLISAADADEWRRLAEAVARSEPKTASSESSPRARRLLDERIEEVEPVGEDETRDASRLMRGPYGRFMTALTVASLIGEVDARDAESWQERLADRVAGERAEEYRLERERTRFALPDLRRVLPGPATRPSGLTLVSAELYADACQLCWVRPYEPPDPAAAHAFRAPEIPDPVVEDDVGTEYLSVGGGGGTGMGATWHGSTVVLPTPPKVARELTVRFGDDRFVVDLREQGTRP